MQTVKANQFAVDLAQKIDILHLANSKSSHPEIAIDYAIEIYAYIVGNQILMSEWGPMVFDEEYEKYENLCVGSGNGDQDDFGTMHPTIQSKCGALYEDRYYVQAVERGFKIVKDRLRHLTGFERGGDAFGKGSLGGTIQR